MAIEGLNSILRQREAQYSGMQQKNCITKDMGNSDEAISLLFDYLQKSNAQIINVCADILNNQKKFSDELTEIKDKLEQIKP